MGKPIDRSGTKDEAREENSRTRFPMVPAPGGCCDKLVDPLAVALALDAYLLRGPCERAPKRCFDAGKVFPKLDPSSMCDSCAASWHASMLANVLRRSR